MLRSLDSRITPAASRLSARFIRRGEPQSRVHLLAPWIRPLRPHTYASRARRRRRNLREMLPSQRLTPSISRAQRF